MLHTLKNPRLFGSLALALAMSAGTAMAADYPDHPVSMIIPFTAGGPTDNVARSLGEAMQKSLGQTVVIENKAGAGGTIGTTQVANAKPDGYDVLLMHIGFSTAPSLYKRLGYDPEKSFRPVGLVVDVPMTLVARSDFPANNMKELVEYLKANQDKVTLANAGVGAASHLCGTMLMDALGVKLLTVPYKGAGPAMNDLLGKQVDLLCDQTTNTTQHIKAKTVKAYAITSAQRNAQLPDLLCSGRNILYRVCATSVSSRDAGRRMLRAAALGSISKRMGLKPDRSYRVRSTVATKSSAASSLCSEGMDLFL